MIPPACNAEFVCQMEEVLDVYQRPYDERYPQVCLDEASKQLVQHVRDPLPAKPGQPAIVDYEYERNGTANLFMLSEPLTGRREVRVTARRTAVDYAHANRYLIDEMYPHAEKIVLVQDNLNTHHKSSLYAAFSPQEARRLLDKLEIHDTPKHGSWLNMAEIEWSVLGRQCLDQRIPDQATLTTEVAAWTRARNACRKKIHWHLTTADARVKLKRLYPVLEPLK